MTRYAFVKDGVVEKTMGLPKNTKRISGLNKMGFQKLKQFGFLPYEYNPPVFDSMSQKLGETTFTILEDKVVGTNAVINLVKGEIDAIKSSFINTIKPVLTECMYHTDWIYLDDSKLTVEQKTAYVSLRGKIKEVLGLLGNLSAENLKELINKIDASKQDIFSRTVNFSVEMVSLQIFLDTFNS